MRMRNDYSAWPVATAIVIAVVWFEPTALGRDLLRRALAAAAKNIAHTTKRAAYAVDDVLTRVQKDTETEPASTTRHTSRSPRPAVRRVTARDATADRAPVSIEPQIADDSGLGATTSPQALRAQPAGVGVAAEGSIGGEDDMGSLSIEPAAGEPKTEMAASH